MGAPFCVASALHHHESVHSVPSRMEARRRAGPNRGTQMKRMLAAGSAALLALSMTTTALANGQGTPIAPEPAPAPTQLEPQGPAPAQEVTKTSRRRTGG